MSKKQVNQVYLVVRPDAKGRIALGAFARGISSFAIHQDKQNRLVLEPFVEIPASEQWLFSNKTALKQVKQGLCDSAAGRLIDRGSFSQYQDEDID